MSPIYPQESKLFLVLFLVTFHSRKKYQFSWSGKLNPFEGKKTCFWVEYQSLADRHIPITALAARDLQLNCVWKILFSLFILLVSVIYPPSRLEWKCIDNHSDLELCFCLLGQDFKAAESYEEPRINFTRCSTGVGHFRRTCSGLPSEHEHCLQ